MKLDERLYNAKKKESKLNRELGMYTNEKLKFPILIEKHLHI
jgi:hypothetical protein